MYIISTTYYIAHAVTKREVSLENTGAQGLDQAVSGLISGWRIQRRDLDVVVGVSLYRGAGPSRDGLVLIFLFQGSS